MSDSSQPASGLDDVPLPTSSSSPAHPRQAPESTSKPALEAEDEPRQRQLRKAGQDFLDRALKQASKGEDPFAPAAPLPTRLTVPSEPDPGAAGAGPGGSSSPSSASTPAAGSSGRPFTSAASRRRGAGGAGVAEDPDVAAFGQAFEGSKVYAYIALFLLCHSASLVLVKGSMAAMKTPAILTFLHMLSVSLAMWLASAYDVFDLTLSGATLKGSSVRVCLYATQMICTFSALLRSSVNFVVAWQCIVPPLLDAALQLAVLGRQPAADLRPVMAAGAGLAVLEMLADSQKSWLSFLMLTLWTVSKAAEWLWGWLRNDATGGGFFTDYGIIGRIREVADEEEALSAPRRSLLVNALPAVPVLLLGFVCLEGNELVDHELSVPAVSVMLLSCAAYTVGTGAQLLLDGRLDAQAKVYLRSAALLGTVLFNYVEHLGTRFSVSFITVVLAGGAASVSGYISWLDRAKKGQAGGSAVPAGSV